MIKTLTKQLAETVNKRPQIVASKKQFIDDYEQEHLFGNKSNTLPRKRLTLSKSKRFGRGITSG